MIQAMRDVGVREAENLARMAVDETKLALYNRHKQARGLADADDVAMNALGYSAWLISSCFLTVEMRYWWRDRLVGVGIVDLGRTSASSVYFYFDPDESRRSPGP